MKSLLAGVFALLSVAGGLASEGREPVLVELFTSEGCSSCPPADALIESLQRSQPVDGAEIIPLALHVDYFNHLGWKDPFSSAAFTRRQEDYSEVFGPDSVYTPQVVVDGAEAVPGNEPEQVRHAIGTAVGRVHLPVRVSPHPAGGSVHLSIDVPPGPKDIEQIQVVAALTQEEVTSIVKRGENKGRTLHHIAVVRKIQRVGALTSSASVLDARLPIDRGWGPNLQTVVWLQGVTSRRIYGTAVADIPR